MDSLSLGSTYAIALCRLYGVDPDEKVQGAPLPFEGEDQHPDDYDGPCACDTCMSYGAEDC
jgi:hypothetical protein